ncbi:glutathione S-transferase [Trichoderma sp. SZMC 28011]
MSARISQLGRQLFNNMGIPTDITLYTAATPNGIKASILLEELGLEYKVHAIDMTANEQKEEWFLAINPNGRIPALTDKWTDGSEIRIFESGAILQYLVDRYDKDHKVSYPKDSKETWEVNSWLHFQMGGLGPMQGQANHFNRYAPEKIQYGINRYTNETRRLYSVLNNQLAKSTSGFLVGDRVTIADIASWGWVASHAWAGVSLDEFPALDKWLHTLLERPGFEKGRHVPKPHTAFDLAKLSPEEMDKKAEETRNWVQSGMQADAKK